MPETRSTHEPHARLRELTHLIVVALGWLGFVWMWVLVAQRPWESQRLLWLIAGSFILLPLLTFAWVLHNRSLYRRKGERRAVAMADASYTHDWHGRSVHAEWALLRASRFITISVTGERKLYRGTEPVAAHADNRSAGADLPGARMRIGSAPSVATDTVATHASPRGRSGSGA
jgi:hypothetical protein